MHPKERATRRTVDLAHDPAACILIFGRIERANARQFIASEMRLLDMPGRAPTPLDIAILRALAPEYSDHLVLMLGETMPPLGWAGFALAAVGVALATRKATPK